MYASLAITMSHGQVSGGDTIDYSGGIPILSTSNYIYVIKYIGQSTNTLTISWFFWGLKHSIKNPVITCTWIVVVLSSTILILTRYVVEGDEDV